MKKYLALIFVLLFVPFISFAASNFFIGDNVNTEENLTGNIFMAGENVTVSKNINGNLYVAGNRISITSNITGYVFAVGNEINISGNVGGNLHTAGAMINLTGSVGGDLFSGSSVFETSSRTFVKGESYIGGNSVNLDGQYEQNVKVDADSTTLKGRFLKDVYSVSGSKFDLDTNSLIVGNLNLSHPTDIPLETLQKNVRGEVNFTPLTISSKTSNYFTDHFFSPFFFGIILVAIFLSLFIPNLFSSITELVIERPAMKVLYGLIVLFAWIGITFLFLIPFIIGWPISLILGVGLFISYVFFYPIMGFVIPVYFIKPKKLGKLSIFLYSILGSIILILISTIPFVGGIMTFIAFLSFLGVMWQWKMKVWTSLKKVKMI